MTLKLYELEGTNNRRFSPFVWRIRMALAHKGLEFEPVSIRFTEKEKLSFSGQTKVPVLVDGDHVIYESWDIACYLEDNFPDTPSLFGGEVGRGQARFINQWADHVQLPAMAKMLMPDVYDHLHPEDHVYFRTKWEKALGKPLEDVRDERDHFMEDFLHVLTPIRETLESQPFLCGEHPAHGDYIVFGAFQWARIISPYILLDEDDNVFAWRKRMLSLFNNMANEAVGY